MEQFKKGTILSNYVECVKIVRIGEKYYTTSKQELINKDTMTGKYDFRIKYHLATLEEIEKWQKYLAIIEMRKIKENIATLINDLKAIKQLSKDVSIDKQELTERLEDIICWCEESIEDYNKEWNND